MSELSRALGNAVPGNTIESAALNKTVTIGLVDQRVKVEFEKRLYATARQAVTSFRHDLDSEQYVAMLSELCQAYERGDFAFEGARGSKAVASPRGGMLLLALVAGITEHEALNLMAEHPVEVAKLLEISIQESFPGVKFNKAEPAGNADPKQLAL